MLLGFLYGIIAAFFWSLTNLIDKHLTSKHAEDGNVWGIVILSCFFPAILLPVAMHFAQISVLNIQLVDSLLLMATGGLMVVWIYFYLKALTEEDTSTVMTLLVLAPFFSLLFGNIILSELPTPIQLVAGAFLVAGSLVVSYEQSTGTLRKKLLFYAIVASICMGLMHSLFKFSTIEGDFWQSMFWRSLGMVISGLILCFTIKSIRDKFYHFITNYLRKGLSLNAANETFTLAGDLVFGFAILFAPIALIQTTEAYQPVFIIILSFLLSQLFGFESIQEDYSRSSLIKKIIGVTCVIIGSLLLVLNSNI
jgi:drug/metabolite transporter (DMT)-like permease